jgi:FKBP-type peptidyl-prolyl cis-trans isomerase FkpA
MYRLIVTLLIALFAAPAFAADTPKTEDQKILYAIGFLAHRSLSVFNLTPAEFETVKQGFVDAGAGKSPEVEISAYTPKVQQMAQSRRKAQAEKQIAKDRDFIERKTGEKGAVTTASGLVYRLLKEGSGATPGPADRIKVNYRSTLPDGKEFDGSYNKGEPVEVKMDSVIKCWSEGLQKMKAGGKAELVCPPQLAYGEAGAGELIPPGATLVFEVELLEVRN